MASKFFVASGVPSHAPMHRVGGRFKVSGANPITQEPLPGTLVCYCTHLEMADRIASMLNAAADAVEVIDVIREARESVEQKFAGV